MYTLFSKYLTPSQDLTVDKMLSLFRGTYPSKVFMKNKPGGKYGILVRMLEDSQNRYVLKVEVYTGKGESS